VECETKAFLAKLDALDQRTERRRTLGIRLQTATPCGGTVKNRRNLIRSNPHLLDGIQNSFLIIENLVGCCSDNPRDLRSGQPPTALSLLCGSFEELERDLGAVAPLALHRVTRRQALAAFVEQFAGQWARSGLCHSPGSAHPMSAQQRLGLLPGVSRDDRCVLS
jgi:hypothetical protein